MLSLTDQGKIESRNWTAEQESEFNLGPKRSRFSQIADRRGAGSTAGAISSGRSWYSRACSEVSATLQWRDSGRRSTRKLGRDLPRPTRHRNNLSKPPEVHRLLPFPDGPNPFTP